MTEISIREAIEMLDSKSCKHELLLLYSTEKERKIRIAEDRIFKLSKLFSVLSNPLRLKILVLLSQTPLPVCIISRLLKADQTLISHHLQLLKNQKLVKVNVRGKFRIYKINEEKIPPQLLTLLSN